MSKSSSTESHTSLNLSVVVGTLNRPAQLRELKSGQQVLHFDLRIRPEGQPSHVVPVSLLDPPDWIVHLSPGERLLVIGRVRQQWFGSANKFTDVLADRVVRATATTAMRKGLANAMAVLQDIAP